VVLLGRRKLNRKRLANSGHACSRRRTGESMAPQLIAARFSFADFATSFVGCVVV
jgi:hypothetical protein